MVVTTAVNVRCIFCYADLKEHCLLAGQGEKVLLTLRTGRRRSRSLARYQR
jgi:MoaA/NifB/PqqE/SkfB family radical SAM enzyme